MDTLEACLIFEGEKEGDAREALAYLIKTGIVWRLQGFYGRAARAAIDTGAISEDGEILGG